MGTAGHCININMTPLHLFLCLVVENKFNLSRDVTNYPAFFFCNTTRELLPYVHLQSFDLTSTAKFIMSYLHVHLKCDELHALKFEHEELEYCVNSLASAINSPDFNADGLSVHEFLQILNNVTHPYLSTVMTSSGNTKKKGMPVISFDQEIIEAAEGLVKNSLRLIDLNIIPLLVRVVKEKQFQSEAFKLLWNLLHQESIKSKVLSNHPGICDVLNAMATSEATHDQQLSVQCCLWLLEKNNQKGMCACILKVCLLKSALCRGASIRTYLNAQCKD